MENDKAMQVLQQMIGNTYRYEGQKILVSDVRIKGNKASVITDKNVIELLIDDLENELQKFDYVGTNQLIRNPQIVDMVFEGASVYQQLQSTLIESIQKVKEDKGYIEQAQTINETIKQVIDLEKVKLQAIQLLK